MGKTFLVTKFHARIADPQLTYITATTGRSYANLPTIRQEIAQADVFAKELCKPKVIEAQGEENCLSAINYRDELGRFRQEDIQYKKNVAQELKIFKETLEDWIFGDVKKK
ncbi:MAG: hypothetical protein HY401_07845 [Elusimicrobia bacterium]|nr:hypothetical protein [Elusimicrobiota bacterium]